MSKQNNIDKNKVIAESYKNTMLKRQNQTCIVIKCKVDVSKLSLLQKTQIKMMFVESKWIYNQILNDSNNGVDIFKIDSKNITKVLHYNKEKELIESQLEYIGSSIKQSLVKDIQISIKTLSKLKKKGLKVGALKFKSDYTSINFKQYGITHKIVSKNKIKLQGIKNPIYVNGLKQLEIYKNYDIANCKLIKDCNDFFIYLTIFVDKNIIYNNTNYKSDIIGIDFGCKTTFTLSNGLKYNIYVEESDRLKRLQRKIRKSKKGSNNRYKLKIQLQKEYRKLTNQKNDLANKFVNKLLSNYKFIVIQDEQLNTWKYKHGKKVQHSIMGRVKDKLSKSNRVYVLSKWMPTTKLCTECGHIHDDIKIQDRIFNCPKCNYSYDRDIHAAQNMIWLYKKYILGMDYTEFKRADFQKWLNTKFEKMNHEAAVSLLVQR